METYNFQYPTSSELMEIEQELRPVLTMDDPIFQEFPEDSSNFPELSWDQMNNFVGMMQWRGYSGPGNRVKRVGAKRKTMSPGVFGEYIQIDEEELTKRVPLGQYTGLPIPINDLVLRSRDQLTTRHITRITYLIYQLVVNGEFAVYDNFGALVYKEAVDLLTYSSSVAWSNTATAKPLNDLRQVKLLSRGRSTQFNGRARLYMNQGTANKMFANTNQDDLAGKRGAGLQTIDGLNATNRVLLEEDLPQIVISDGGYLDEANEQFQLYIPDDVAVVIGRRTSGVSLGSWKYTRNLVNTGSPFPYNKVVEMGMAENQAPPPKIQVHRGFNGGPEMHFPEAIVVMNV